MPCKKCGLNGHNSRTCIQNNNTYTEGKKEICIICYNNIKNILITPCEHTFCSKCIFTNITHGNFCCPLCRTSLVNPKISVLKRHRRLIHSLKKHIKNLEKKLSNQQNNINII